MGKYIGNEDLYMDYYLISDGFIKVKYSNDEERYYVKTNENLDRFINEKNNQLITNKKIEEMYNELTEETRRLKISLLVLIGSIISVILMGYVPIISLLLITSSSIFCISENMFISNLERKIKKLVLNNFRFVEPWLLSKIIKEHINLNKKNIDLISNIRNKEYQEIINNSIYKVTFYQIKPVYKNKFLKGKAKMRVRKKDV